MFVRSKWSYVFFRGSTQNSFLQGNTIIYLHILYKNLYTNAIIAQWDSPIVN